MKIKLRTFSTQIFSWSTKGKISSGLKSGFSDFKFLRTKAEEPIIFHSLVISRQKTLKLKLKYLYVWVSGFGYQYVFQLFKVVLKIDYTAPLSTITRDALGILNYLQTGSSVLASLACAKFSSPPLPKGNNLNSQIGDGKESNFRWVVF